MIHTFSVSNYGSIREEVTLDLRIPGTAPDLARFRRSADQTDVRLPTVAVLMGPNGSGKTTLLRAMVELGQIVSSPADPIQLLPFASIQSHLEPTRLSLEGEGNFLVPDETPRRFRYEVSVGRQPTSNGKDEDFVAHEALVHFPKGRRRRLFERGPPETPIYVSRELGLTSRDDRLKAVDPHRSAIATLGFLNVPVARRFAAFLQNRLVNATNIVGNDTWAPDTSAVVGWLESDPDFRRWAQAQLQQNDLGIGDLAIKEVSGVKHLCFTHKGLDSPVLLYFESTGTRRLVHLLPLLKGALDVTGMAILDEIDGALHVDMLGEILNQFRSHESNRRNAQLLVSSHHVGLLDDLEKEELFIVEKNDSGATRVYSAQDVRGLRRDVRLYPKYRAGVLGGLPRIG